MDLFKEEMHNKALSNGHICRDAVYKEEMKKLMPLYKINQGNISIQEHAKINNSFLEYYLKVDSADIESPPQILKAILKKYFNLKHQEHFLKLCDVLYDSKVCDEYIYIYYPLICLATLHYLDPSKYFAYCDQDNNMHLYEIEEYKEKVDLIFTSMNIDPSKYFVKRLVEKRKQCEPFPGTVTTELVPRNLRKKYAATLLHTDVLPTGNPPLSSVSNLLRREVILSALTCADVNKINSYEDFRYTDPSDCDIWEYLETNIVVPLLNDRLNRIEISKKKQNENETGTNEQNGEDKERTPKKDQHLKSSQATKNDCTTEHKETFAQGSNDINICLSKQTHELYKNEKQDRSEKSQNKNSDKSSECTTPEIIDISSTMSISPDVYLSSMETDRKVPDLTDDVLMEMPKTKYALKKLEQSSGRCTPSIESVSSSATSISYDAEGFSVENDIRISNTSSNENRHTPTKRKQSDRVDESGKVVRAPPPHIVAPQPIRAPQPVIKSVPNIQATVQASRNVSTDQNDTATLIIPESPERKAPQVGQKAQPNLETSQDARRNTLPGTVKYPLLKKK